MTGIRSARPNRRQILVAGAVAAAATTVGGTQQAFASGYGSGDLGDWQSNGKAIASDATIRSVRDSDGVFMFGDSIGVQDGYSLAVRLGDRTGDLLAVNNWSGRPTAPAVDALQSWATNFGMPRRILMATGTNDIFTPPDFGPQVDRVMQIAGPTRTVIWVNVQCSRWAESTATQIADQRNGAWINLQLSDRQKTYPNLKIVHWAEFLAAMPSRLTMYLRDGVHTKVTEGQDARNELIVQALAAAK